MPLYLRQIRSTESDEKIKNLFSQNASDFSIALCRISREVDKQLFKVTIKGYLISLKENKSANKDLVFKERRRCL